MAMTSPRRGQQHRTKHGEAEWLDPGLLPTGP